MAAAWTVASSGREGRAAQTLTRPHPQQGHTVAKSRGNPRARSAPVSAQAWHKHHGRCSASKRQETLTEAAARMDLGDALLREATQPQRDRC